MYYSATAMENNSKKCIDIIDKLREIEHQQIYMKSNHSHHHSNLDIKVCIRDRLGY